MGTRSSEQTAYAREVGRKGIHLTSAVIPLLLAIGVARGVVIAVLATLFTIALGIEAARFVSPTVRLHFTRLLSPLLRVRERDHVTGATWLLGGMLLAVVLLRRDAAVVATWAVAIGDACAAIVGMRFGRHRTGTSGKSIEGSAACFIVTTLGALLLARMSFGESVLLGSVATIAERAPWPVDDNARIVTLVGAAAWLWSAVSY